jgi:membrane glycosyltransferase
LPRALGVAAVLLKREHADYGGRTRLLASAGIEMVVSALQAPVRMVAHSAFVLGTLTGLRLDWKSPPREAQSIAWGDALRRIGLLAAPVVAFAVLALPTGALSAPHVAPLLAALLLAVPLAVLSSHPRLGAALRAVRMLWVPEERHVPRTLQRASEQRTFADLVPLRSVAPPRLHAPAYSARRLATHRVGLALGSVATAVFVALTPGHAITPELPDTVRVQMELQAATQALESAEPPTTVLTADSSQRRALRARPARMIDEAVRARARDAVQRMMTADEDTFEPA